MTSPGEPPAVPPLVRTVAYFVALVAGALGTTAIGITAVVSPAHTDTVAGIVGAILGGITTIAGGLGVVYRPTKPNS